MTKSLVRNTVIAVALVITATVAALASVQSVGQNKHAGNFICMSIHGTINKGLCLQPPVNPAS